MLLLLLLYTSSFMILQTFVASQLTELDTLYCQNGCSQYFDGCNNCNCNADGTSTCTSNTCTSMTADSCIQCQSNQIWNECGSPCTKDCSNLVGFSCIQECQERCECPLDLPIWDSNSNQCVPESNCNVPDGSLTQQSVPSPDFIGTYCNNECLTYFDGCNVCNCTSNITSTCETTNICDSPSNDYCLACPGNQEWNECGSQCLPTCDDPSPTCITDCLSRCYCPYNTVWNGDSCINAANCTISVQPQSETCLCESKLSESDPNLSIYTRASMYCREQLQQTDCNLRICTWKCK